MTLQQNVVNALSLLCEPEATRSQALGEAVANLNTGKRCFYEEELTL